MKRLLLLVLLAAPAMAQGQSPQDLYQQALRLENSQGDLSGAIVLYQRVAAEFGSDRALGAQALLRIGQAYEQLGETEAERAYRRIVAEFGDQAETVAFAEAALDRLAKPAPVDTKSAAEWVAEELREGGFWGASFSPDGRFFVNTTWELDGSPLGFQERDSDQVTYITPQEEGRSYPVYGRFSPDNSRIAYMWFEGSDSSSVVKVYNRTTGTTRDIFKPNEQFGFAGMQQWVELGPWTSDGKHILTTFEVPEGQSIALLGASDGTLKWQHPTPDYVDGNAACLLDDRYAIFRAYPQPRTELTAMDLQTGEFWTFLEGDARVLGCSPSNGTMAVAVGGLDDTVWLYRAREGRVQSDPVRIPQVDGADAYGLGISEAGEFHFYEEAPRPLQEFSFTKEGRATVAADPVYSGWTRSLGWSHEGQSFGYLWTVYDGEIVVADGSKRPINFRRYYQRDGKYKEWRRLRLSADGTAVIAVNAASEGEAATYWIDPATGIATDTLKAVYADVSTSGTKVLAANRRDERTMCVGEYDRDGSSREVVCYPDDVSVWAPHIRPSGDGTKLLITATTSGSSAPHLDEEWQAEEVWRASVVVVETGEVQRNMDIGGDNGVGFLEWAPDGLGLMESRQTAPRYHPLDGSGPREMFGELWDVRSRVRYSLHPRENRMMVHSRATGDIDFTVIKRVTGLWGLMEDAAAGGGD